MVMTVKHVVNGNEKTGDSGYEAFYEAEYIIYDPGAQSLYIQRPSTFAEEGDLTLINGYAYVLSASGRFVARYALTQAPSSSLDDLPLPDDQPYTASEPPLNDPVPDISSMLKASVPRTIAPEDPDDKPYWKGHSKGVM